MTQRALALAALAALTASPAAASAFELDDSITPLIDDLTRLPSVPGNHIPGEVIVRFEGAPPSLMALGRSLGVELDLVRRLSGGELLLRAGGDRIPEVGALVSALRARRDVRYAQPNYVLRVLMEPDDELYGYQWHYPAMDLPAAWEVTTGDPSVVVAVLDSGITNHPDLIEKRVPGYDFVSHLGNAADGDGIDADPTDPGRFPIFHGTHVAGTIGADSNNGLGVAGVCWGCMVEPVRVLGSMWGTTADVIEGIRWAAGLPVEGVPINGHPADVINMSLGEDLGEGLSCAVDDPASQSAIDDARAAGVVVVAAAGNSHADAASFTPAACDGVITVAAVTRNDHRAYYSNFGETIDVSAPGGGFVGFIWSTYDADLYMGFVGTSQASPHVAGLVGLMLSVDPQLSDGEILDILQETASPIRDHKCPVGCGAGRVDAFEAVLAARGR